MGREMVLNSKGEFNRCKIARLRLIEEEGEENEGEKRMILERKKV